MMRGRGRLENAIPVNLLVTTIYVNAVSKRIGYVSVKREMPSYLRPVILKNVYDARVIEIGKFRRCRGLITAISNRNNCSFGALTKQGKHRGHHSIVLRIDCVIDPIVLLLLNRTTLRGEQITPSHSNPYSTQ